ncbi:MAG: TRAP transporter substrate-binding protein [Oscillospiraceae bacterium]|nr:TRAP transporter substrate-binding protein [Oscillospiraceae bacterium]
MKEFKKVVALVLVVVLVFALTACGSSKPADTSTTTPAGNTTTTTPAADNNTAAPAGDAAVEYDNVTINFNGTTSDSNPIAMGVMNCFEKELEARSNGAVQVEVYLNSTFGTGTACIESVQAGSVQAGECTLSSFASYCPDVQYTAVPFTFNSREEAYAWTKTDVAAQLKQEVSDQAGVYMLSWFENGIRMLSNGKKEVTSPADMAGLKIRVMDSPAYIEMFTEMGASATPMAYSELYTALQQGTVDGQDNPYSIFVSTKFYEVQKYFTDLSHTFDFTAFFISNEFMNGLNEATRNLIIEVGEETEVAQHEYAAAQEADNIQAIKDNGVTLYNLSDDERAAFKASVAGFEDWFKANVKSTITWEDFQASVEEAKANA